MKKTPMKAIKSFCIECIYDNKAGGTDIQQVEDCTHNNCPLFDYRPLTKKTRDIIKQEKINNMTPEEKEKYDKNIERLKSVAKPFIKNQI